MSNVSHNHALLRGINVGKAKRVPMAELRALLAGLGYGDVQTLLNSGNAVFTHANASPAAVERALRGLGEVITTRNWATTLKLQRWREREGIAAPPG